MGKPKITLYVDIVSPFAWIAFHVLQNSPVFKGCEVEYVPIFLGGLMKMCNNRPPLFIKNKDLWINTERLRWSHYFSVPISRTSPPGFPNNTLPIQRALVSLSLKHPHLLSVALNAFWQDFWVQWKDPLKPDAIFKILSEVLGGGSKGEEEAKKVVETMQSEEVKKVLGANTERAFQEGAFGLPWFTATNAKGETEGFWGVDHLGQMCDFLGLERPRDGKGWRAML